MKKKLFCLSLLALSSCIGFTEKTRFELTGKIFGLDGKAKKVDRSEDLKVCVKARTESWAERVYCKAIETDSSGIFQVVIQDSDKDPKTSSFEKPFSGAVQSVNAELIQGNYIRVFEGKLGRIQNTSEDTYQAEVTFQYYSLSEKRVLEGIDTSEELSFDSKGLAGYAVRENIGFDDLTQTRKMKLMQNKFRVAIVLDDSELRPANLTWSALSDRHRVDFSLIAMRPYWGFGEIARIDGPRFSVSRHLVTLPDYYPPFSGNYDFLVEAKVMIENPLQCRVVMSAKDEEGKVFWTYDKVGDKQDHAGNLNWACLDAVERSVRYSRNSLSSALKTQAISIVNQHSRPCGLSGSIKERVANCAKTKDSNVGVWRLVTRTDEKMKAEFWLDTESNMIWSDLAHGSDQTIPDAALICADLLSKHPLIPDLSWRLPKLEDWANADYNAILAVLPRMDRIYWSLDKFKGGRPVLYNGNQSKPRGKPTPPHDNGISAIIQYLGGAVHESLPEAATRCVAKLRSINR